VSEKREDGMTYDFNNQNGMLLSVRFFPLPTHPHHREMRIIKIIEVLSLNIASIIPE
jgi:hypothetical protein